MMSLNDGVQVLPGSVLFGGRKLIATLGAARSLQDRGEASLRGSTRLAGPHDRQCPRQETVCSSTISPVRKHEVDQNAVHVDGAVKVLPPAACLIYVIHAPAARPAVAVISPYIVPRRVAMYLAHGRGAIHFHPASPHHLRQIPAGDPVLAVANGHRPKSSRPGSDDA